MMVNLLPKHLRSIKDIQQPIIEPDGNVASIQDMMSSDRGPPSSMVTRSGLVQLRSSQEVMLGIPVLAQPLARPRVFLCCLWTLSTHFLLYWKHFPLLKGNVLKSNVMSNLCIQMLVNNWPQPETEIFVSQTLFFIVYDSYLSNTSLRIIFYFHIHISFGLISKGYEDTQINDEWAISAALLLSQKMKIKYMKPYQRVNI